MLLGPHPVAAVHRGDEHDGRQDHEAEREEADHHAGAARIENHTYYYILYDNI